MLGLVIVVQLGAKALTSVLLKLIPCLVNNLVDFLYAVHLSGVLECESYARFDLGNIRLKLRTL